jgi:nitronate monooxygenase
MRQCCCSSGARARSRRSLSGAKRQSWQRPEGGVRDESWRPSRLGLTEVVDEFPALGTNLAVRRATLANVTALSNRLTNALDIRYPIISAPMAFAGGGALAAAVSRAGGLGLIGGGYGDPEWIEEQFQAAQGERVGVGFITWSAARRPSVMDAALAHRPAAVMLSFGDPLTFAADIKAAGAILMCQCQNLGHVRVALDAEADIVVAQGSEAGGHGADRGTFTLVPEVADLLAHTSPDTMLVAAGGVADGRGLAAAVTLGADGVLVGTRLCASQESLVKPLHRQAIVESNGDATMRTHLADIVRELPWPQEFTARIQRNGFVNRWHGRESDLAQQVAIEGPRYLQAFADGDPEDTGVWFGEAAGLIDAIEPAATIVERMVTEATHLRRSSN